MNFEHSKNAIEMIGRVSGFMDRFVYPNEQRYLDEIGNGDRWEPVPLIEELKSEARSQNLWNLFLPDVSGLSNLEYAPLAEIMGGVFWSSEVFNCSAPDTGNMEVLHLYGNEEQKEKYLKPLLDGEVRSCFCMTEPDVASSDATSIRGSIERDGDYYIINGRKWWSTGGGDRRCKFAIFMGKTDRDAPVYKQQSMIIVPLDTEGVSIKRMLNVYGYDDAPSGHAEIEFENVRVSAKNLLLGEGRGFEIAQGRLGPGRVHHCMRLIGLAERALTSMKARAYERKPFGKLLIEQGVIRNWIAESRNAIDQARLLVLKTAWLMDTRNAKEARKEIAMIKAVVPAMAEKIIDRAIQVYGGAGVCQDTYLPFAYATARMLRIADGPDEVHMETVAKLETRNGPRSE